jgi:hypothetical protein
MVKYFPLFSTVFYVPSDGHSDREQVSTSVSFYSNAPAVERDWEVETSLLQTLSPELIKRS